MDPPGTDARARSQRTEGGGIPGADPHPAGGPKSQPRGHRAGLALFLLGSRVEYLAPFRQVILSDYGISIAAHLGLALVTGAAFLYGMARAVGLAEALQRDVEGEWD